MPEAILLLAGPNQDFLAANLYALASRNSRVTVFLPTDEAGYQPELVRTVARTYQYACWRQGGYRPDLNRPVVCLACPSQELLRQDLTGLQQLALTPDTLEPVAGEETMDISVSAIHSEMMEVLEPLALEIDEELLRAASQHLGQAKLLEAPAALALAVQTAQDWLELPLEQWEAAWQGDLGALYRCLQDMQLWQDGLLQADRPTLERAIRRAAAAPQDWAAHLVLLLFKRCSRGIDFVHAPGWFEAASRFYLETPGRFLEILPPVTDFTVSILVPTYNRLSLLQRAVQGILAQTYSHWQLIIADDASSDGTEAYGRELAAQYPDKIQYLRRQANAGFNSNIQLLYETANTELLLACCDDDWMLPNQLELTVGFFKEHPWVAMVSGSFQIFRADGSLLLQHGPYYPQAAVVDPQTELQRCGMICPVGPMCLQRKAILRELAAFDTMCCPDGQGYAVWDYMSTTKLLSFFEIGYVPEIVAGMTADSETQSAKRDNTYDLLVLIGEIYRGYCDLFGEGSYPASLIEYLMHFRAHDLLAQFQNILQQSESVEILRQSVVVKQAGWEQFVQVKQEILPRCSRQAPVRFNTANPYRL